MKRSREPGRPMPGVIAAYLRAAMVGDRVKAAPQSLVQVPSGIQEFNYYASFNLTTQADGPGSYVLLWNPFLNPFSIYLCAQYKQSTPQVFASFPWFNGTMATVSLTFGLQLLNLDSSSGQVTVAPQGSLFQFGRVLSGRIGFSSTQTSTTSMQVAGTLSAGNVPDVSQRDVIQQSWIAQNTLEKNGSYLTGQKIQEGIMQVVGPDGLNETTQINPTYLREKRFLAPIASFTTASATFTNTGMYQFPPFLTQDTMPEIPAAIFFLSPYTTSSSLVQNAPLGGTFAVTNVTVPSVQICDAPSFELTVDISSDADFMKTAPMTGRVNVVHVYANYSSATAAAAITPTTQYEATMNTFYQNEVNLKVRIDVKQPLDNTYCWIGSYVVFALAPTGVLWSAIAKQAAGVFSVTITALAELQSQVQRGNSMWKVVRADSIGVGQQVTVNGNCCYEIIPTTSTAPYVTYEQVPQIPISIVRQFYEWVRGSPWSIVKFPGARVYTFSQYAQLKTSVAGITDEAIEEII